MRVKSSAYERNEIGTIINKYGKRWQLSWKWQIAPYHKCPHCKNKTTFHSERIKCLEDEFQKSGRLYENTYICASKHSVNTMTLVKSDLCLRCGRDWVIEMFCWERLGIKGVQFFQFDTGKVLKGKPWKGD